VSRQVDGATPQPVQKMTFEELLLFVARQQKLAGKVYTCYEAGPFGYHLHRRLEAMGVTNFVVQPQDWDDRGKGVKNDRLDALALCQRLDRYVRGNQKAFSVVRVPSEEEERERAMSRQRQQLVRERQRLAAMGRSLLAMHNIHVTGRWWKGKAWARIKAQEFASAPAAPETVRTGTGVRERGVENGCSRLALLLREPDFGVPSYTSSRIYWRELAP
jgi:transposase